MGKIIKTFTSVEKCMDWIMENENEFFCGTYYHVIKNELEKNAISRRINKVFIIDENGLLDMTLKELKAEALKNKVIIYSVTDWESEDGWINGYKVFYAINLNDNTVSAEAEVEIEAEDYYELLKKIRVL